MIFKKKAQLNFHIWRKTKSQNRRQINDLRVGITTKWHEGFLEITELFYYLDRGGGYTMYTSKLKELYIKQD